MKPAVTRVAGASLVLLLLVAIAFFGNRIFVRERLGAAGTEALGDEPTGQELRTLTLYFGARDSVALVPERRDIPSYSERSADLRGLFDDLAGGPVGDLVPLVPPGTRVRHVFVDVKGTVYVDFSREIVTRFEGGFSRELLLVRSLARTLSANYTGLSRLQILVDGRAVPTLGGHLDVSRPLTLSEWS